MKWIIKILVPIILIMQSCATFKSDFGNEISLNKSNLNLLNGKYEITPFHIDSTPKMYNPYKLDDNILEELDRYPFTTYSSTYKDDFNNYYIELEIESPNFLIVNYLKEGEVIQSKRIKTKLKKNGFLYLKNENIKAWGIPYLLGAMDVHKNRITIDRDNNLVLEVSNFRGGAAFLIAFLNFGNTAYRKKARKI